MYNYARTIDDLPKTQNHHLLKPKEIRIEVSEMLNSQRFKIRNEIQH